MSVTGRILIAAGAESDGEAVRELLKEEFPQLEVTLDESGLEDFNRYRPDVLVLAFRRLERADAYYRRLYRRSDVINSLNHSAIVLCDNSHVNQAYEMCRAQQFDDYVVMWPLNPDHRRIFLAIYRALAGLTMIPPTVPATDELAAARRIAELEAILEAEIGRGVEHSARLGNSIQDAQTRIDAAFSDFSRRLVEGGLENAVRVDDPMSVREALHLLEREGLRAPLRSVDDARKPLDTWVKTLDENLKKAPLARRPPERRPIVLMVDDDAFHCRLMAQILEKEPIEFNVALNGESAIEFLRRSSPRIILMDIGLPDVNGIELTRRIRAMPNAAGSAIVMITGKSERRVVVESIRAGALDFVVKPFDKTVVLKKLHKLFKALDASNL